ncbi:hypothetical protein EV561_10791 [Rhizobium sp. BK376]|nr:hypothetical protein EV561_10791 [Rhizobium sp. BK376]
MWETNAFARQKRGSDVSPQMPWLVVFGTICTPLIL